MAPLYAAVAHGCQAGRHQQALDEVYWQRILRGNRYFSTQKLGAIGADLAALSGFFDPPWRQIPAMLSEDWKGLLLVSVGFNLRALGRLVEAIQPLQASLDEGIAQKDWHNSATRASILSELHLTIGDLAQALNYARQSVELADRSSSAFERMARRTILADALHHAGRLLEAEAAFCNAEEMQKARQPELMFLYSVEGFRYCDLLLSQGKYEEVQSRASQALEWARQDGNLLSIALHHLCLGRAYFLQAQSEGIGDYVRAAMHLERAVDGLRQAGQQQYLPLGLLARAELRRVMGAPEPARADLEEALSIATRGGMRLYQADCHLEYARLYLACDEKEKARESLDKAKRMIEEMGYHRRDGEVAELEGELESLSR